MVMIRVYQYAALCFATYYAMEWYIDHKHIVTEYVFAREDQTRRALELRKAKMDMKRQLREQGIVDEEEERKKDLWKIRMGTIH